MRGKILNRTATETVSLALAYVGVAGIHYHLEYPNGGTDPSLPPQDKQTGGCDCIGFALNVAGLDRFQPGPKGAFPLYGGYINTDSMIEEAMKSGKWFTVLDKPEEGCFIVAHTFTRGTRRVIGHIGVVTDCSEYATKALAGIHVVHCSPSNVKRPGNKNGSAVWKTDGTVWGGYPKVCFVRFNREYAQQLKVA